ncbi:MAG: pyridoxamine 5'-phosphate oxidase family protein [Chloroflexi bacterium]|nr:MAG: pyridoxamine 5'-phosphate oxidase family protein [Chloroflexota bacterium]
MQHEPAPARSRARRRADVLAKLESEVDLWVASASAEGDAYLVPLSFAWDGTRLTIATPKSSVTGRNLARRGWARVALGPTRDVVIIEGPVEVMPVGEDDELAAAHAAKAGLMAYVAMPTGSARAPRSSIRPRSDRRGHPRGGRGD